MAFAGVNEAVRLVKDLKFFYGKKFIEQWDGYSDVELAKRFAELLSDVHLEQFEYGMKRLETSAYIPNMPQFKSWCMELKPAGQNWLSVSEAWALCLSYDNKESVSVSKQAMAAFKKVHHILMVEGQKPAYRAFQGFYERITENDKQLGRSQEAYTPPLALASPAESQASGAPMTDEQREVMNKSLDALFKKLHVTPKTKRSN